LVRSIKKRIDNMKKRPPLQVTNYKMLLRQVSTFVNEYVSENENGDANKFE
jgi:hypothetical protein